jgi:hypothetical protein
LLTSKHRKPCRMMRPFCPPSESRRASTMASESVRAECCGRMRMIGSDEFEFRRSRPTPLPVRCQGELHLSPSCNAWTPGGKTLRWIKHVFAGVAALGKAIALFPHDYHAFNLVIYVCSHRSPDFESRSFRRRRRSGPPQHASCASGRSSTLSGRGRATFHAVMKKPSNRQTG